MAKTVIKQREPNTTRTPFTPKTLRTLAKHPEILNQWADELEAEEAKA